MRVVVLTLDGTTDRQKSISEQFRQMNLGFEFHYGVDGRKGEHPLFRHYDPEERLKAKGEPLSPGQLGCFASHYQLWERVVETGEPMLVLEDDASIDHSLFEQFVELASSLPEQYECIRLFCKKSRRRYELPLETRGPFVICKYLRGPMLTVGYYITPSGAKKFLAGAGRWTLPVDIYMDEFWKNGVECYGITPYCVKNDPGFDSVIGYIPKKKKPPRGLMVRLRREIYTFRNNVSRILHNLAFRLKARSQPSSGKN